MRRCVDKKEVMSYSLMMPNKQIKHKKNVFDDILKVRNYEYSKP